MLLRWSIKSLTRLSLLRCSLWFHWASPLADALTSEPLNLGSRQFFLEQQTEIRVAWNFNSISRSVSSIFVWHWNLKLNWLLSSDIGRKAIFCNLNRFVSPLESGALPFVGLEFYSEMKKAALTLPSVLVTQAKVDRQQGTNVDISAVQNSNYENYLPPIR